MNPCAIPELYRYHSGIAQQSENSHFAQDNSRIVPIPTLRRTYKFKKIVGRVDFSDQFRKIIVRYKRIGYNINIMRQSACLVFNPITVNNFASLFNCTPVGRASDSMMAPT